MSGEEKKVTDIRPISDASPNDHASVGVVSTQPHYTGRQKVRTIALVTLIVGASSALCLGMLTGTSAWYTSRSDFCNSCHIMDPYFHSWQTGTHAEVACIKCHFAPGTMEKIQGKMQGLVQLCTYLTRSQGPRPVAEVSDASCLRSGCHEVRSLAGPLEFHGVYFDHGPHLGTIEVGKDHHEMTLRCTSCHGQIDPSVHMMVSQSNCYLCHFKDGLFNEGIGACTRCHQVPETSFDLGGGVSFNHELVYENGIDCKSCHGELNRGTGLVGRERCQVCHNMETDLAKMGDGKLMHDIHVTEHKVDCLDCHAAIEHSLQPNKLTHAASDCAACHPNHHHEQVQMLMGTGAKSVPDYDTAMMTTRVECRACHSVATISSTGTVVWKASAEVCTACHSAIAPSQLEAYEQQVTICLADLEGALQRVREALAVADVGPEVIGSAQEKLEKLSHDVDFLKVGSGIHNIHYASTLTRVLIEETKGLCRSLNCSEPTAELPESVTKFE